MCYCKLKVACYTWQPLLQTDRVEGRQREGTPGDGAFADRGRRC